MPGSISSREARYARKRISWDSSSVTQGMFQKHELEGYPDLLNWRFQGWGPYRLRTRADLRSMKQRMSALPSVCNLGTGYCLHGVR